MGADWEENPTAEIALRSDGTVPLPAGTIDLVLSTQVLEHVDDPAKYLDESFRLLRPGGSLVLSTHGVFYYYHGHPNDHWRWTYTGLTKIVEAAGFSVKERRGVMGQIPVAIQLLQDASYRRAPSVLKPVFTAFMQFLIWFSDRSSSDEKRLESGLVGLHAIKPI